SSCVSEVALLYAVACEIVGDVCGNLLCRRDIGGAAVRIASFQLGKTASIKGACKLGVKTQSRVVIGDCSVPLPLFQICEGARIERGSIIRLQPQGLVAIRQRVV